MSVLEDGQLSTVQLAITEDLQHEFVSVGLKGPGLFAIEIVIPSNEVLPFPRILARHQRSAKVSVCQILFFQSGCGRRQWIARRRKHRQSTECTIVSEAGKVGLYRVATIAVLYHQGDPHLTVIRHGHSKIILIGSDTQNQICLLRLRCHVYRDPLYPVWMFTQKSKRIHDGPIVKRKSVIFSTRYVYCAI